MTPCSTKDWVHNPLPYGVDQVVSRKERASDFLGLALRTVCHVFVSRVRIVEVTLFNLG